MAAQTPPPPDNDVARIHESASQFHALVEQQIAGIFIIRNDGLLAYINPLFTALFGYTPAEVIGRPFVDLIVEKDRDTLALSFAEHLKGGPLATQTATAIMRKGGGVMDVLAHASLSIYEGKPALVGILIDITKEKRATDLLHASEERYRLLVEQAPDAILLYDVDANRFVTANASAEALFECSHEELMRLEPLRSLMPDDEPGPTPHLSNDGHIALALTGADCVFERRVRSAGGRESTCEIRLVRWPTVSGRLVRVSLIDITERRLAEQARDYRDRILHAMTLSVATVVTAPSVPDGLPLALQTAAEALQVDRLLILRRIAGAAPTGPASTLLGWQAADVLHLDRAAIARYSTDSQELNAWLAPLSQGTPVTAYAATTTGAISQFMRDMRNLSTVLVPIFVAGTYWGHLIADDCRAERHWKPVELDMLGTLSQVIGAMIMREHARASLKNSEERFRAVSDAALDAIVMVDSTGHVEYWNRAAERIFGYGADEAVGKSLHEWLAPARYQEAAAAGMQQFTGTGSGNLIGKTVEMAALRKGGIEIPVELSVASMLLGAEWHAVATIRDISERRRIEAQIKYSARHDALTGLANRSSFVERLQQELERARQSAGSFAVLYLDLDHFKDINDTLGHPVGDLLLQSLAKRLQTSVRGMDALARFGGDEFGLIQVGMPTPLDAAVLANQLLEAISEPFTILGKEIRTGASVGIAVYGPGAASAETLLSHADVALFRAKSEGRGTYRFFTDAMDVEVRTRVMLGADLRDAIPAGQLFLMYQPQIDVDNGLFVGVEALARWRHPTRGLVRPEIFIPLAEQSGLIVELGRWVLRQACRQMKEWIDMGIAPPLMAVNVSGLQFRMPLQLDKEIAAILTETALPAQRLEIEVTESVLMEISRERNDTILRLRTAGHRIALDDFGTGYSSLEYLSRFPVDRIKIAQSFIVDLTSKASNRVIVKAAIGLAHELNLDVVVEGVETPEQLKLVRSWGCRKVQGYYFSRPVPAAELTVLLRSGHILPGRTLAAEAAAG